METTVIRVLVLVFSVVVHEVAHGWTAWRLGDDTARRSGRLTLNPLPHLDPVGSVVVPLVLSLAGAIPFGWAKPVPVDVRRLKDPWNDHPKVAAAGPASNLLLALICAVSLGIVLGLALTRDGGGLAAEGPNFPKFLVTLLQTGIMVNIALAMFNLVPLPPLDGSWILTRFLPHGARVSYEKLRGTGFLPVVGFLLLMRYTGFGDAAQSGLMTIIRPFLHLSLALADMIGG
ncbi:MAG: site-2 protease family protein [bacterium]|nr:site-2 protease family protein [bacterium]